MGPRVSIHIVLFSLLILGHLCQEETPRDNSEESNTSSTRRIHWRRLLLEDIQRRRGEEAFLSTDDMWKIQTLIYITREMAPGQMSETLN
jgi:hypothetical protein